MSDYFPFILFICVCILAGNYVATQERAQQIDSIKYEQIHCPQLVEKETIYCVSKEILEDKKSKEEVKPSPKETEKYKSLLMILSSVLGLGVGLIVVSFARSVIRGGY